MLLLSEEENDGKLRLLRLCLCPQCCETDLILLCFFLNLLDLSLEEEELLDIEETDEEECLMHFFFSDLRFLLDGELKEDDRLFGELFLKGILKP